MYRRINRRRRELGGRYLGGVSTCQLSDGTRECQGMDESDDEFFSCITSEIDSSDMSTSSSDPSECSFEASRGSSVDHSQTDAMREHFAALACGRDLLTHAHNHPDDTKGCIERINKLKMYTTTSAGLVRVQHGIGTELSIGILTLLAVVQWSVGEIKDAKLASYSLAKLYPNYDMGKKIFEKMHHHQCTGSNQTSNTSRVHKSCLKSSASTSPSKKVTFSDINHVRMFAQDSKTKHVDYMEPYGPSRDDENIQPVTSQSPRTGSWVPPSVRRKKWAEQEKSPLNQVTDTIKSGHHMGNDNGKEELGDCAPPRNHENVLADAAPVEPKVTLFQAALQGKCELVMESIKFGPYKINDKDSNGQTALMIAAAEGNKDVLTMLVEKYHADLNIKDIQGKTALMLAASVGRMDIVRILKTYAQG